MARGIINTCDFCYHFNNTHALAGTTNDESISSQLSGISLTLNT
jgi:hypothetical protein